MYFHYTNRGDKNGFQFNRLGIYKVDFIK